MKISVVNNLKKKHEEEVSVLYGKTTSMLLIKKEFHINNQQIIHFSNLFSISSACDENTLPWRINARSAGSSYHLFVLTSTDEVTANITVTQDHPEKHWNNFIISSENIN